jgi:serine/threonine protein kinase
MQFQSKSGRKLTSIPEQNFLVDASGHVKLTDFGLATGALNPQKIESMKHKVSMGAILNSERYCILTSDEIRSSQLDQVKDENLVFRSTLERRTIYKSMRMAEPRYVSILI